MPLTGWGNTSWITSATTSAQNYTNTYTTTNYTINGADVLSQRVYFNDWNKSTLAGFYDWNKSTLAGFYDGVFADLISTEDYDVPSDEDIACMYQDCYGWEA